MSIIQQLSIFLENKPGALARLCKSFSEENINIEGMSVSDGVDYAVVRLVTSDSKRACHLLESAGVLVVETDVLALTLPDHPGELAKVASRLAKAEVNIDYAYGTVAETGGTLILRV